MIFFQIHVLCFFLFVGGSIHVCAYYENVHSYQHPVCIDNPCPVCCQCETNICRGDCNNGFHGALCKNNCPDDCMTCQDHSDISNYSSYANCTKCKDGFYVTPEWYQCQVPCPSGCKVCTSNASCSVCKPGFYGDICNQTCSIGCSNNTCDKETGECGHCINSFKGSKCDSCTTGKFGANCSIDCPENCQGQICNMTSGDCFSCIDGKYGRICGSNCTGNCLAKSCGMTNGECLSCKENFAGSQCMICRVGMTGLSCNQTCGRSCAENQCNRFYGNCTLGCIANFAGPFCDQCMEGKFGVHNNCSFNCSTNCQNRTCNKTNGVCHGCKGNLTGKFCGECVTGVYGHTCNLSCPEQCLNNTCDKEHGTCFLCQDGFKGPKCDVCENGKYGESCNLTCATNCMGQLCNSSKRIGFDRFSGEICNTENQIVSSPFSLSPLQISIAAVSAVIAAFLVVILTTWLLRKKRLSKYEGRIEDSSDLMPNESNNDVTSVKEEHELKMTHDYVNVSLDQNAHKQLDVDSKQDFLVTSDINPDNRMNYGAGGNGKISMRSMGHEGTSASKAAPPTLSPSSTAMATMSYCDMGEEIINRSEILTAEGNAAILKNDENIRLGDLVDYVRSWDEAIYQEEFLKLPKGLLKSYNDATKPENMGKNRYNGIYPYDETRVKLTGAGPDYINACFVNGYKKERQFIATLGPIKKTTENFETFWRMVWQQKVEKIVMVTNLREQGSMKCEKYWPDKGTDTLYGDVKVTCTHVRDYSEFVIRTFLIEKDRECLLLLHYHFTAWPDKAAPEEVTSIIDLRHMVNATKPIWDGPVIVHCSAGIGRTGTYIALDYLTEQGRAEGYLDVLRCVSDLRQQRTGMVQKWEQYRYIHMALVQSLLLDSDPVALEDFNEHSEDEKRLAMIFKKQDLFIEAPDDEEKEAVIRNKLFIHLNREGADIPGDLHRVRLYLDRSLGDCDYINAVYVDSFLKKNQYIIAQTPLRATVKDFLMMVVQERCPCIVSLEDTRPDQNVGIYVPRDNKSRLNIAPELSVSCSDVIETDAYVKTVLKISYSLITARSIHTVFHFRFKRWQESDDAPSRVAEVIELIEDVMDTVQEGDGPVIVHCLNGGGRSGLFCLVSTLLERMDSFREISVVNALRRVRFRRPAGVQNLGQFLFCYRALSEYLRITTKTASMSFDNTAEEPLSKIGKVV